MVVTCVTNVLSANLYLSRSFCYDGWSDGHRPTDRQTNNTQSVKRPPGGKTAQLTAITCRSSEHLHSIRVSAILSLLLGRLTGKSEGLKFYPWTFFFFLFYQSIALSSNAVDGHQMYSGGLAVGKASTIGIEISPTPPLIFTGGQKCEIWRRFQHHSTLSRPRLKMHQNILTLKQISCVRMIALCPCQVW